MSAVCCTHSQNGEEEGDEEQERSVSHTAPGGHEEELLLRHLTHSSENTKQFSLFSCIALDVMINSLSFINALTPCSNDKRQNQSNITANQKRVWAEPLWKHTALATKSNS